jgi:hypothetical protein
MPGIYREGLFLAEIHGKPNAPIVIRGTPGAPMPIFRARPSHHTIDLRNISYIVIRGLELNGLGLQQDGVRAHQTATSVHHITLDGLYIHGHGADQQTVGISAQCPAWGWIIRNNRIVGAGTGMYLGSSDGSKPFFAGVIEHNEILNSIGYDLQIKHQTVRPATGDNPARWTIIRHNVFGKAEGSSATSPRPNVLLGHWPLQGPGSTDQYLVYANLFYENPHEALLQGEGNITLYGNAFVNSAGRAINIMPHKALPRRIEILQNTVVAKTGIRMTGGEPGFVRRIKGNAVLSDARALGADPNLVALYVDASAYLVAPAGSIDELNLSPRPGKLNAPTRLVLPSELPGAARQLRFALPPGSQVRSLHRSATWAASKAWASRAIAKRPRVRANC